MGNVTNPSREDTLEPPFFSRLVNNDSGGRGSGRVIGLAGGVATGRYSPFVSVVLLMVSVTW